VVAHVGTRECYSSMSADWRSDPAVARRVVDAILGAQPPEARRSYCEFLGQSITYLSRHHPCWWGVTLYENLIRLNAGWVESLVLHPGGLRVLVEVESAPAGTNFDGHKYRHAPGCETAAIALSELPRLLPGLGESHRKALEIAGSRRSPANVLGAHSKGITEWLSQVLCREVPNPVKHAAYAT
jgi:hypothetical protein